MRALATPLVLKMGVLFLAALGAFGIGWFVIRRLRHSLVEEVDAGAMNQAPLTAEGLPVHAYQAVIQQLKQQKHELVTQHLAERRKAKTSDTLSSTILLNLSCGVLFFDPRGLVRQANPAARKLLGFASPVGLHLNDMFRSANLRPESDGTPVRQTVEQALAPALTGTSTVRGLVVNYFTRDGDGLILEATASPVVAEDASLMGMTLVIADKTDIERIRHDQRTHRENSAEMALGLRHSLAAIAGSARQLASGPDAEQARVLADDIAHEAAQVDRTIGSFLGGARAASSSS